LLPKTGNNRNPNIHNALCTQQSRKPPNFFLFSAASCFVNNFTGWCSNGRLGHIAEMEARVKNGSVWGQQIGSTITLVDKSSAGITIDKNSQNP
jgi:hypothetical protein